MVVLANGGSEGRLALLIFLVLELTGGPCFSSDSSRDPMYSRQWAVHIEGGGRVADEIAAKHGFINLGEIFTGTFHFHHNYVARRSADPSEEHHGRLASEPNVQWAKQQVIKKRVKRDFMPFRPRSSPRPFVPNDPRWPQMWYLNRGGGLDMNVKPAWQEGITGKGIVVTILDDGLEKDHPDLHRNYDPEASYDVNNHDEDPMPRYDRIDSNRHGTRCAGEVAATANNSICAVGVAFGAGVGGVRMLDGDVTDAVEARSLSLNPQHVDIYSASWGPDDDGKTVDGPGELATRAFVEGVTKGRGGKGSIFVWASGNGGRDHDNCNCDGYTNAIWTLSISSATENGLVPWYSEACSSTLATTYSSGSTGEKQVVTTDLRHQCTTGHTGTSASAPLAAGICALALEANRRLTWRDMQHIVVRTAKPANLRAPDWSINGVGRNVSHSFGYGLMDASAMVRLARTWKTVPEQHRCEVMAPHIEKQIPAKSQVILQLEVKECSGVSFLEHVQAKITLMSSRRGDLQIHLTSPAGTRSTLLARRPHDVSRSGFQSWPFMSVHSWGEKPLGTWQLEIHNEGRYLGRATLREWALIFHGTPENPDHQRPPTVLPAPHPPRRGGSSPLSPQSTRPRGHPSGSSTKKNKYIPRGRNGTNESPLRSSSMTNPVPPKPTSALPPPTTQDQILQAYTASPALIWGPLYFGDAGTSIPLGGTVSRIADPVNHPPEAMSGLLGSLGSVANPRPPPPRRLLPGSLPRDGRPGSQTMDSPSKGSIGDHGIATLTDWNLILHGTGTAPGESIGVRPGEGNGIAARNSSGDSVKDKNAGRAPTAEAEVIPGGNGGQGRARWKQEGGSGNGAKPAIPDVAPVTNPPLPQLPQGGGWQDRKDQRNGVERTSTEEVTGGCNATRGCIECSEGLFLHQGKCEPACPQQRFFIGSDASSNPACLPCHYSCKACFGPNDYQCTECFEDSIPFDLHTYKEQNQTAFRCIPSDVSRVLQSEYWSFWLFVAFLLNAALILFIFAWQCCYGMKKHRDRTNVEGHMYEKVGSNDSPAQLRTRESNVINYQSSDDEDMP